VAVARRSSVWVDGRVRPQRAPATLTSYTNVYTIYGVYKCVYNRSVTASELKRKLRALGCTFEESTNHTAVILNSKRTVMPRHPAKEIKTGTLKAILKALGIEQL
jgi:mRNA interferase HicA